MKSSEIEKMSIIVLVFSALCLFVSNFSSLMLTLHADTFVGYVPVFGGALAFVFFSAIGLQNILKSLDFEKYVSNRAWLFVGGALLYLVGFLGSVLTGAHGIYYMQEHRKAEIADIERVLISFATLQDKVKKNEAKAISDYTVRINSQIDAAVEELKNRSRPGAGDEFKKRNDELQRALGGVSLEPLSGPVNENAITAYYSTALKLRNENLKAIRSNFEAFRGFVDSGDVVDNLQILAGLKTKPVQNDKADREMAIRVAYTNYALAYSLAETTSKSLGVDIVEFRKLDSIPPSTRLADISFFVKHVFSLTEADNPLVGDRVMWSIIAAFILELLFVVSVFSLRNCD